jgi:uncharacterized protein (DUF488 family)
MGIIKLFTIGFTQKSAEEFFTLLINAGVKRVIDVRLHNTSQMAGFTKMNDLRYFLKALGNIDYAHMIDLAPEDKLLQDWRDHQINWDEYKKRYLELLKIREIDKKITRYLLDQACLLCSELEPKHCHRSLAAEYFKEKLGDMNIIDILYSNPFGDYADPAVTPITDASDKKSLLKVTRPFRRY